MLGTIGIVLAAVAVAMLVYRIGFRVTRKRRKFFKKNGDYSEITDFGYDDIAFYDKDNNYLFFTTTHEGYLAINAELI